MKQFTFFAAYMLLFGSLLGVSSAYGQSLMNGSANFTVGDGALLSVHGLTKNAGTVNVTAKGMVNLHGNLDLRGSSIFRLKSRSYTETASLIGYGTISDDNGGKIISERFITGAEASGVNASDGKWHYFTSPVGGQALDGAWVKDNKIAFWDDNNDGILDAGDKKGLDFWRWNEPTSKWIHFSDQAHFQVGEEHKKFKSGYGYITAVKSDGRAAQGTLEFKGNTFNAKTFKMNVTTEGETVIPYHCWKGWNLIGNPFPSAYDIRAWLTDNDANIDDCHKAVYLYLEQDTSNTFTGQVQEDVVNKFRFCSVRDYRVISNNGADEYGYYYIDNDGALQLIDGTFDELGNNENKYLAVGQAFFVKVKNTGELEFKADGTNVGGTMSSGGDHRVHAFETATFRGDKEVWPSFALLVNDDDAQASQTIVSFKEGMTDNLDASYDVVRLENPNQSVAVYSQMVGQDRACGDLALQALPPLTNNNGESGGRFDEEETLDNAYIIPVGITVDETRNINFNVMHNQLDDQTIILEDRKLNVFTKLKEGNYTTTAEKAENGYGRFYIHFGPKADEDMVFANNLQISAYMIDKHQLKVLNPAHVVGDYKIFDMNGSILYDGHLNGNGEQIVHVDLPLAMYVLHVNTTLKSQSFKFINK